MVRQAELPTPSRTRHPERGGRKRPAYAVVFVGIAYLSRPSPIGAAAFLSVLPTAPPPPPPTAERRRIQALEALPYAAALITSAHVKKKDGGADLLVGSAPPPPTPTPRRRSNRSLGKLAAGHEKWYGRLEELRTYLARGGGDHRFVAPPPSRPVGLAGWIAEQRSNHAKWRDGKPSPLTDDRREALDDLDGFDWDTNDALWRSNLEALRRYRDEHGGGTTADVPHSGGSLGRWVHLQRLEYNRWARAREESGSGEGYTGSMTAERAAMLKGAGMEWDPRRRQFDEMTESLRRFKKATGHINVGAREGRLSAWFYRQRRAYRDTIEGKKSSAMTEERRTALEELGFRPDMFSNRTMLAGAGATAHKQKKKSTPKIKVSFDDSFEKLKLYRDFNGHCNVPQLEGKLGRFVRHQRQLMTERRKQQSGDWAQRANNTRATNTLTDERIERLESIDFVWDLNEFRWNEKFEQLREYAEENGGDCNVPQSYGELGDWCEAQREHYTLKRTGKGTFLTDEREEALTKLGFTWRRGEQVKSRREAVWNRNLNDLREYKDRNGHCRVPRSHTLAGWVSRQRSAYRALLRGEKSTVTEERRRKMEYIGFD